MAARDRFAELRSGDARGQREREMEERRAGNDFSSQMSALISDINRIESNVNNIAKLHEKALVGVNQQEIKRITRQLDDLQDETNDRMDAVRTRLKAIADETKRLGGSEQESRKAQQARVAQMLQKAAQKYSQVQVNAKNQYRTRMEREIKIARPDVSQRDVDKMLDDSRAGSAFAHEMLSSRVGSQRRVLQEVESRQNELRKMEESIEELATLFMDLQVLLETQQEQINTIEVNVDQTRYNVEDGGREIGQAIEYRKSSRKKLWCILALVLILLVILAVFLWTQRCPYFGVCSDNA